MKTFLKFLAEGSRGTKRLLRIIDSSRSTPSEIHTRTRADWLRDQSRAVVRGVKQYLNDSDKLDKWDMQDVLQSGGVSSHRINPDVPVTQREKIYSKADKIAKRIEKKYPGTPFLDDPRRVQALPRTYDSVHTNPGSTQHVVHKTLATVDPGLNTTLIKTTKRLSDLNAQMAHTGHAADEAPDMGADFASHTLNPQSSLYAFNPTTRINRVKWRRHFNTIKAAQKNPLDGVGSEGT